MHQTLYTRTSSLLKGLKISPPDLLIHPIIFGVFCFLFLIFPKKIGGKVTQSCLLMKGNPEFGNSLLVESGILDSGIRNTAQGIRKPTINWNPESEFH